MLKNWSPLNFFSCVYSYVRFCSRSCDAHKAKTKSTHFADPSSQICGVIALFYLTKKDTINSLTSSLTFFLFILIFSHCNTTISFPWVFFSFHIFWWNFRAHVTHDWNFLFESSRNKKNDDDNDDDDDDKSVSINQRPICNSSTNLIMFDVSFFFLFIFLFSTLFFSWFSNIFLDVFPLQTILK